jgi:hypothetical protein
VFPFSAEAAGAPTRGRSLLATIIPRLPVEDVAAFVRFHEDALGVPVERLGHRCRLAWGDDTASELGEVAVHQSVYDGGAKAEDCRYR